YFYARVGGIEPRVVPKRESTLPASLDPEANAGMNLYVDYRSMGEDVAEGITWVCGGPLSYDATTLERDIGNLRDALDGLDVVDAFIPAVAPGSVYWLRNEHYPSEEEFLFAFADALHEEYTR